MTSRYLIDIENRKSKIIHVYRNGDKYNRAALVLLRPIEQQKLDRIFRAIEEKLTLPYNKPIRKIYTVKGIEIEDPILVKDQRYYVVGSSESFINTKYGSIYKWAIIGPVKWSKFADVFYEPPEQDDSTINPRNMYPWRNNTINSAKPSSKMTKSMSTYPTERKVIRNSKMMTLSLEQRKRPVSEPASDMKAIKKRNADTVYFDSRKDKNSSGDDSITSPKISAVENHQSMDQFLKDSLKMYKLKDQLGDNVILPNEEIDQYDERIDNNLETQSDKNEYLKDIEEHYLDNNIETNESQNTNNITDNDLETKGDSECFDEKNMDENHRNNVHDVENINNGQHELDSEKEQQADDLSESSFIINEIDDVEDENTDVREFEENELKAQMKEAEENDESEVFSENRDTIDFAEKDDMNENVVKLEDEKFSDDEGNISIREKERNSELERNIEGEEEELKVEVTKEISDDEAKDEIKEDEEKKEDEEEIEEDNKEEQIEENEDGEAESENNSEIISNKNENIDVTDKNDEEGRDDENQDYSKSNVLPQSENDIYTLNEYEKESNMNLISNECHVSDHNEDLNNINEVQENEDEINDFDSNTIIKQRLDSYSPNNNDIIKRNEHDDISIKKDYVASSENADQYDLLLETSNINSHPETNFAYEFQNTDNLSNNTMCKDIPGTIERNKDINDSGGDMESEESEFEVDSIININKNDHKFKERENYDDNAFEIQSNKNESDSDNLNDLTEDHENNCVINNDNLLMSDASDKIIKDEEICDEDELHYKKDDDCEALEGKNDQGIENKHHFITKERGNEEEDEDEEKEKEEEENEEEENEKEEENEEEENEKEEEKEEEEEGEEKEEEIEEEKDEKVDEINIYNEHAQNDKENQNNNVNEDQLKNIENFKDEELEQEEENEEIEIEKNSEKDIFSYSKTKPVEIQIFENKKDEEIDDTDKSEKSDLSLLEKVPIENQTFEFEKDKNHEDFENKENDNLPHLKNIIDNQSLKNEKNEEDDNIENIEVTISSCSEKDPTEDSICKSEDDKETDNLENIKDNVKLFSENELSENQTFESENNEEDDNTQNNEIKVESDSEKDQMENKNFEIKINDKILNDDSNVESEKEPVKCMNIENEPIGDHREQYNRIDMKVESPSSFINKEVNEQNFNEIDKENAAKIIQKNFRGHLVRKELIHDSNDIDNDESEEDGHRSYDVKDSDDNENENDNNVFWSKDAVNDSIPDDNLNESSKFKTNYSP